MITDHHNEYNNEEIWNVVRITKIWHRDTRGTNAVGKMVPKDLLNVGLPQKPSICKKNAIFSKHNRPKCNKMRYALLLIYSSNEGKCLSLNILLVVVFIFHYISQDNWLLVICNFIKRH